MNCFYYTRSLALLIFFGLFSSPAHAIFTSLSLWAWNPDGKKDIKIFIIGDVPFGGYDPNEENSRHDAKNYKLLKHALYEWNKLDDLACLVESNALFAKYNKKENEKEKQNWDIPIPLPYWGIYYTLSDYIKENKKVLSNITFNMCDMRYKAYYETKKAILILREMFAKFDIMLKTNDDLLISKSALQKNMKLQLSESSTISAEKFLYELRQGIEIIKKALNPKDYPVDKITRNTLENYSKNLTDEINKLKEFFNKQLDDDLNKSTFEAFVNYITNEAELNKKNQRKKKIALDCIEKCLKLINDFNTRYEKVTNCVTDAGFILTLLKQKKSHKNIVIFCSNNHAVDLSEYLQKYKEAGKASCYFAKGFLEYNYGSSSNDGKISHIQAKSLFCIPFNKEFDTVDINKLTTISESEKLTKATRSYICANCLKISIDKKFLQCSQCKATNYCSTKCQYNDWKQHKKTCVEL